MTRVLILASGKGGTGKTSVTAGLGCALGLRGKRCLLIDADAGMQSLDLALGVYRDAAFDFTDVASGTIALSDAAVPVEGIPNVSVLAAPVDAQQAGPDTLETLIRGITGTGVYDYILIDAPAGIGRGFEAAARAARSGIVVATADPICLRSAEKCAERLTACGVGKLRLIVNRVRRDFMRRGLPNIDDAIDAVGVQLLGFVPEDETVALCGAEGVSVLRYPRRRASRAFSGIAARLTGEQTSFL